MHMMNSGPVLLQEDLEMLESRVGMPLPEEYVEFLKRSNGGSPEEDEAIWDGRLGEDALYLQYFLPVTKDTPNVSSALEAFPVKLAEELIPVCLLGGGSYLLLNLADGSVCLWDYDSDEVTRIAGSLSEFFSKGQMSEGM